MVVVTVVVEIVGNSRIFIKKTAPLKEQFLFIQNLQNKFQKYNDNTYSFCFFMKSFLLLSLSIVLLSACSIQKADISNAPTESTPEIEENSPIVPTPTTAKKEIEATTTETNKDDEIVALAKTGFTATEVAEHNSATDCWLILDGKVYEVTDFIPSHPGGKAILKGCGKDATKMFSKHPESAKAMKEQFYIGDLK